MKLSSFGKIVLSCWFFLSQPAFGWWETGHEVVARIAAAHLTPAARTRIARILSVPDTPEAVADALATASIWADQSKGQSKTGSWHYIDLAIQDKKSDILERCRDNNCVTARIRLFALQLSSHLTERAPERTGCAALSGPLCRRYSSAAARDFGCRFGRQLRTCRPAAIHCQECACDLGWSDCRRDDSGRPRTRGRSQPESRIVPSAGAAQNSAREIQTTGPGNPMSSPFAIYMTSCRSRLSRSCSRPIARKRRSRWQTSLYGYGPPTLTI